MSQQDYQITLEALQEQRKKVTATPEAARAYLIALCVLDEKGKVDEKHQALCTLLAQD
ncbi:hypothetical protein Q5H93_08480 [Hymenobacter sp. ASUV-10]|uniref:Uncharacterized protein n=1 Tax=Hymenobacter aranciens TaxID=3063996 RepID=A0ABT9BDL0_9BACT|nr:hypothetical protein [Hymenobacter sp. ASUV-10]MDO7874766.1 hypothetical protein [Hymenobacter sp. ASUV-10]